MGLAKLQEELNALLWVVKCAEHDGFSLQSYFDDAFASQDGLNLLILHTDRCSDSYDFAKKEINRIYDTYTLNELEHRAILDIFGEIDRRLNALMTYIDGARAVAESISDYDW